MENFPSLPLLALAALATSSPARAANQARFVPLGLLDSGTYSTVYELDADGTVLVGSASNATLDRAVQWTVLGDYEVHVSPQPFDSPTSALTDVSADGAVVVGYIDEVEYSSGFRVDALDTWTPFGYGSGFNWVRGLSADGTVIAISTDDTYGNTEAVIGSPETGFTVVGSLPGHDDNATAHGLSANGLVLVGQASSTEGFQAFRWTAVTGMQGLGFLTGPTGESIAHDASGNGAVIVGRSENAAGEDEAFRWTAADGMVPLGFLPGATSSSATSVSYDGRTVTGWSDGVFLWRDDLGMVSLQDYLVSLGASCLEGWTLTSGHVSADGNAIAGAGRNPADQLEAYVAYLDAPDRLPPSVPATEVVRLGAPPNPDALLAGQTSAPYVGGTWDPVVDHASFAPGATLDLLVVGFGATNLDLGPTGTLLCEPPYELFTAPPGEPFVVPVPNKCALVGLAVCAQAASLIASGPSPLLTNALDVTLGAL